MEVVRVETLGDIVAFKPKVIDVLGSVLDKVPEEFREDFEVVLNTARTYYDDKVEEAKLKGEKPKSASIKKEAITTIIKPFLTKVGVTDAKREHVTVTRSKDPRIPSSNEKIKLDKNTVESQLC